MGCSTCKSKSKNRKKQKSNNVKFETVENNGTNTESVGGKITENIFEGLSDIGPQNIFMKVIVFCSVLVAIPLFAVYLIFYIFKIFFITSRKNNGFSVNGLINVLTFPGRKWRQFRSRLKEKAIQREFAKTVGYEDMSDIDVLVDEDLVRTREYTGEEELDGVELLETTNKDNDNE